MAISNIDVDGCIGCGTCVSTCPADVIRMDTGSGIAKITYPEDCQSCHLCRLFCQGGDKVITISKETPLEPMVSWGVIKDQPTRRLHLVPTLEGTRFSSIGFARTTHLNLVSVRI